MTVPRIGVLSLQGDFARHRASLEALGVEAVRVVLPEHLEGLEALVMPGGESTTMTRLMASSGLREPIAAFLRAKPVMGTCAGVILLGGDAGRLPAPPFGVLDVSVERNAYGRQIDSFEADLDTTLPDGRYHGVFIRAPRITRVGRGVEVVASRPAARGASAEAVGVRQGRVVGLCFHPELTSDLRFHRWFLAEVAGLSWAVHEDAPVPVGREPGSELRS